MATTNAQRQAAYRERMKTGDKSVKCVSWMLEEDVVSRITALAKYHEMSQREFIIFMVNGYFNELKMGGML